MNTFERYLLTARQVIYKILYKDNLVSFINSKMAKLITEERDNITSPQFINYLIKRHLGELEYSFLENGFSYHTLEIEPSEYRRETISKIKFVNAVEQAYKDKAISESAYLKTKKIRDSVTFDAFLDEHGEDIFYYSKTEDEKVPINVNTMIDMLLLPWEELDNILDEKPFGLTKEEFTYTVLSYFKLSYPNRYEKDQSVKHMFSHYIFPEQIKTNIENLETKYDIALIKSEIQEKPNYLEEVKVNENLWNKVLSKVPEDFTQLEKAYYIYYELCKTFTYSPEYFTWGETKRPRHIGFYHRISDLSSKTEENNHVICYELMAIYQKFLEHLGINFDINDGHNRGKNVDYDAHPKLLMAIDHTFLVEADATRSVITGDMPRAKENRPLQGFKCQNTSETIKQRFYSSLDKVNKYIIEQEKQETSFFDVVNAYKELDNEPFELTDAEKLSIIVNSMTQTDLSLTDSLLYITELTKMLFPEGNCNNYYILDHQKDFTTDEFVTTGIPTLQVILAYQDPHEEEPRYYLYSQETGLKVKTHDELQSSFDTKRYEYLTRYKKDIPDIVVPKEKGDGYAF